MFRFSLPLLICLLVLIPVRSRALGTRPTEASSLRKVLAVHGFPRPVVDGKTITARTGNSVLVFTEGSRRLKFNDILVLMNAPPVRKGRRHYISTVDIAGTLDPLLAPGSFFGADSIGTVLLDPGHGGSDTGAVSGRDLKEKTLVLDIARRTHNVLRARDVDVHLTRDRDVTVPLLLRPGKAAEAGADVFISIHVNASANAAASGIETFVVPVPGFPSTAPGNGSMQPCSGNRFDALNMRLACSIHSKVLARTGANDRGIRRARFAVLREAPCPAILLECGFLSNRDEKLRMMNAKYRQAIAQGIADGIRDLMRSR